MGVSWYGPTPRSNLIPAQILDHGDRAASTSKRPCLVSPMWILISYRPDPGDIKGGSAG